MKKIENFKYNDIVLYAKHWYKQIDLCEDLGYLFSKIYAYTPKKECEISLYMLRVLDNLYEELCIERSYSKGTGFFCATLTEFESEVRKNMMLYDCSRDIAIIKTSLFILYCLDNKMIKLNPPHFGKKERFRLGGFCCNYPISMTYAEMNRIAKKTFDNQ